VPSAESAKQLDSGFQRPLHRQSNVIADYVILGNNYMGESVITKLAVIIWLTEAKLKQISSWCVSPLSINRTFAAEPVCM
jgi:hypothetical protein